MITSGALEEPYVTDAVVEDTASRLHIRWLQLHEGEKSKTAYVLDMDKETGCVLVTREGEFGSRLEFDTSRVTTGRMNTPYGRIDLEIRTEYIKMPSSIFPGFEIRYDIAQQGQTQIKNLFSVKFLLQK